MPKIKVVLEAMMEVDNMDQAYQAFQKIFIISQDPDHKDCPPEGFAFGDILKITAVECEDKKDG